MQAAVYRGKGELRIEDIPVPTIGPGEVLVRVQRCGVCGTDLKKIALGLSTPPCVFGHEIAGIVADVGSGVTSLRPGDRVAVFHHVPCGACRYCRMGSSAQCATYKKTGTTAGFEPAGGGFAEYVAVRDWIVERGMVRIPDDVDFDEAALLEPFSTCVKAVAACAPRPQCVAVLVGLGPIGLMLGAVLNKSGATVVGIDARDDRLAASTRFGVEHVGRPDDPALYALVQNLTDGCGADLIIVATPGREPIAEAFRRVRAGGRVLLFASTYLGDPIEVDAGDICMREIALVGSYSSDIDLARASAEMLWSRRVDMRPLVTHTFPLDRIGEAIERATHPRDGSLKVMIAT